MDILKTLNEHLTLSGNADTDIARVSSLEACRLIRENKLVVSFSRVDGPRPIASTPGFDSPTCYGKTQYPEDNGRLLVSKFNSKCRICENYIDAGSEIYYKKNVGSAHKDCVDNLK